MVDVDRRTVIGGVLGVGILGVAGAREVLQRRQTNCSGPQRQSGTPALGPSDAVPVRVFVDYSCPHCKTFTETSVGELIEAAESGKIQLQHYDFPLPVKPEWSYKVANAGRYVKEFGGDDAFWQFSETVMDHQGSYSDDVIIDEVSNLVDVESNSVDIASVLSDRPYCEEIRGDVSEGEDHGVDGTPTVAVGSDWELLGMPTVDEVFEAAGVSNK